MINDEFKTKIYPIIAGEEGFEIRLIKRILPAGRNPKGEFLCFCGNRFIARIRDVKRAHTQSCGCYARKVRALNIRNYHKRRKEEKENKNAKRS